MKINFDLSNNKFEVAVCKSIAVEYSLAYGVFNLGYNLPA
jgi:hypothetical protein